MSIQVKINDIIYEVVDGTALKQTKDEELDTFVCKIMHRNESLPIEEGQYAQVTANDTDYYFVVNSVDEEYENGIYDYTIQLISETVVFQRITCPNLAITNPEVTTSTLDRSIYTFFSNYIAQYSEGLLANGVDETAKIKLKSQLCPDFQWTNATLYEILNDLALVINCYIKIQNKTLYLIDLSEKGREIDLTPYAKIRSTRTLNNSCEALDLTIQNGFVDYGNTISQKQIGIRTDEVILTTNNMKIILDKNIKYIWKIEAIVPNISINSKTTTVKLDITNYCVNKKVYELKDISNSASTLYGNNYKRNCIYFNEGSNIIDGLSFTEKNWLNVGGQVAIINILENAYYDLTKTKQTFNIDPLTILFDAQYTSLEDIRLLALKDGKYKNRLFDSQTSTFTNIERLAKKENETIKRLGNPEKTLTCRFEEKDYSRIPSLGDYYGDYILYSREIAYYSDYVLFKGILSKNYVQTSVYTGIVSNKRYTQLLDSSKALLRKDLILYNFNLSTAKGMATKAAEYLASFYNTTDSTYYNPKLIVFEYNYLSSKAVVMPFSVYMKGKNDVGIECSFNSNVSAGITKSDDPISGGYQIKNVFYCDENGEYDSERIKVYDRINTDYIYNSQYYYQDDFNSSSAIKKSNSLPYASSFIPNVKPILDNFATIHKDVAEIISKSIQFHFDSNDENIIIGEKFCQYCKIFNSQIFSNFKIYYSAEEKYSKNSVLGIGKTLSINNLNYYSNGVYVAGLPTAAISWSICDNNGNILIAINKNSGFYFNTK